MCAAVSLVAKKRLLSLVQNKEEKSGEESNNNSNSIGKAGKKRSLLDLDDPPYFAPAVDLQEKYYRKIMNEYDRGEVISAMQKEWRRNREEGTRECVALLLLSFHCEQVINRLVTGTLEDVSIANLSLLELAVRAHKKYREVRKRCDNEDKSVQKISKKPKALRDKEKEEDSEKSKKRTPSEPKAWKNGVRNSLEVRSEFAQLATALCRSSKSRITDHVFSVFYKDPDAKIFNIKMIELDNMRSAFIAKNGKLHEILEKAQKDRANYVKYEALVFEFLAIVFATANATPQPRPIALRDAAKNLVDLLETFTSAYESGTDLRYALDSLSYICRSVYLRKSSTSDRFPLRLPITVWVLVLTRPIEQLRFESVDTDAPLCDSEAKSRYERLLGKGISARRFVVPDYAIDKHTARAYALGVDTSDAHFYRTEHKALSPLSAHVIDPYLDKAIKNAEKRDKSHYGVRGGVNPSDLDHDD